MLGFALAAQIQLFQAQNPSQGPRKDEVDVEVEEIEDEFKYFSRQGWPGCRRPLFYVWHEGSDIEMEVELELEVEGEERERERERRRRK